MKPIEDEGNDTKALSREHTIVLSCSGLVTVTGGKWTAYRPMAEDVLDNCIQSRLMSPGQGGRTRYLCLLGADESTAAVRPVFDSPGWHSYGSEQALVRSLPGATAVLCPGLTQAMVRFAAR